MHRTPKRIRDSYRFLIDLLYPNRCPCCQRMILWNEIVCPSCQIETTIAHDALCSGCGKSMKSCICGDMLLQFDGALTACRYEGKSRSGILSLKKAENLNFATYTGEILGNQILQQPEWMMADAIVPVPMHWKQRWLRGKNPAERIADAIAEVTNIPVRNDLLYRKAGGLRQHELNAADRRENVWQFAAREVRLDGYIFILCDDVVTTGSTANRCASLLKACGAEKVFVATATTTEKT